MKHIRKITLAITLMIPLGIIPAYASKDAKELKDVKGSQEKSKQEAASSTATAAEATAATGSAMADASDTQQEKKLIDLFNKFYRELPNTNSDRSLQDKLVKEKMGNLLNTDASLNRALNRIIERIGSKERGLIGTPIEKLITLRNIKPLTNAIEELQDKAEKLNLIEEIKSNLIEKIKLLKEWGRLTNNVYTTTYYCILENIKYYFAKNIKDYTEKEKELIRTYLESFVVDAKRRNHYKDNKKVFPIMWINAVNQAQRDRAVTQGVNFDIENFQKAHAQASETAQLRKYLNDLVHTIDLLGDLISWQARFLALSAIKKVIPESFSPNSINEISLTALGKKLVPGTTLDKNVARATIFEKWSKELEDSTDLFTKIEFLKKMANVAKDNDSLKHKFYKKLEDLKKDFVMEIFYDEINESDEQKIQEELEHLVGAFMNPIERTELSTQRIFANQWVDALEQKERDRTFKDLINVITTEFQWPEEGNEEQAEEHLSDMLNVIDDLGDLISRNVRIQALEIIKQTDDNLSVDIDDMIKQLIQKKQE